MFRSRTHLIPPAVIGGLLPWRSPARPPPTSSSTPVRTRIEIGWQHEPTYVGESNARPGHLHDEADKPVTDLEADDIKVVVSTGGQQTGELTFDPAFDPTELEGTLGRVRRSDRADRARRLHLPNHWHDPRPGGRHHGHLRRPRRSTRSRARADIQFPTKLPTRARDRDPARPDRRARHELAGAGSDRRRRRSMRPRRPRATAPGRRPIGHCCSAAASGSSAWSSAASGARRWPSARSPPAGLTVRTLGRRLRSRVVLGGALALPRGGRRACAAPVVGSGGGRDVSVRTRDGHDHVRRSPGPRLSSIKVVDVDRHRSNNRAGRSRPGSADELLRSRLTRSRTASTPSPGGRCRPWTATSCGLVRVRCRRRAIAGASAAGGRDLQSKRVPAGGPRPLAPLSRAGRAPRRGVRRLRDRSATAAVGHPAGRRRLARGGAREHRRRRRPVVGQRGRSRRLSLRARSARARSSAGPPSWPRASSSRCSSLGDGAVARWLFGLAAAAAAVTMLVDVVNGHAAAGRCRRSRSPSSGSTS